MHDQFDRGHWPTVVHLNVNDVNHSGIVVSVLPTEYSSTSICCSPLVSSEVSNMYPN
jgi:hypothetical protein